MKTKITITDVIEYLNELTRLDPDALTRLVEARVPCNEAIAEHPTAQVGVVAQRPGYEFGVLGLLNGMFGVDEEGWGPIMAVFTADRLVEFRRTEHN